MEDLLDAYIQSRNLSLKERAAFYSALIGCLKAQVGAAEFDDAVAWTIKFCDERNLNRGESSGN